MEKRGSRPRVLRLFVGLLALAGLACVALLGGVRQAEVRGWTEMDRLVLKLGAEAQNRPYTRKALRGIPAPGNAWDEYLQAIALANQYPRSGSSSDNLNSIVDHVRKGTQRIEVRTPVTADPAGGFRFPGSPFSNSPLPAGLQKSRTLAADGDVRGAAELLLDLCMLGSDLCRNGTSYLLGMGSELRRQSLNELRPLILQGKLAKDDLQEIERQMEILDAAAPDPAATLQNRTVDLGGSFLRDGSWENVRDLMGSSCSTDWRHVFSKRLFMIDLFREIDDWNRRASEVTRMPWPEADAVHHAIAKEQRQRGPPFETLGISSYAWAAWIRATDAKVRLLRVAAHFRRTGELLSLDDPLGGRLFHHGPENGRLKIWSLGALADGEPPRGGWSDPAHPGEQFLTIEVDRYP